MMKTGLRLACSFLATMTLGVGLAGAGGEPRAAQEADGTPAPSKRTLPHKPLKAAPSAVAVSPMAEPDHVQAPGTSLPPEPPPTPVMTAPKHGSTPRPAGSTKAKETIVPATTTIEAFNATPFPYEGQIPEQKEKFLDVEEGGRRGHRSPRGGIYWEAQAYSDKSVLLSIPKGTDFEKPLLLVLYMHGNQARLDRDVRDRQHVPQQLATSGLNAVLVAPQFAVDALDSSAGHFWDPGFLKTFLAEAANRLGTLSGDSQAAEAIAKAQVVIVAYSGGYLPTAFALQWGGDETRIHGVILLDALYAEEQRMAEWVARRGPAFFFSAYSLSTRKPNETLQHLLREKSIVLKTGLAAGLQPGSVVFQATDAAVTHRDFVSHAWTNDPMKAVLSQIKGFGRSPSPVPKTNAPAKDRGDGTE